MSSALVKSKLKAARDAISAKDWSKAEQSASDAISFESSNYNARVFLAVAKLNLEKYQESEEAYRTAIDAQPKTLLAWQGLASFYEKTDRWDKYLETQRKLADLALEAEDPTKCAEALQKILKTQRDHGSSKDALDALRLFLPDSSYYPVLSQLPPPDLTAPTATTTYEAQCLVQDPLPILQETIRTQEHDEDLAINREVDKRRQRLTTTTSAEETRKAVLRETMSKSELPALYQKVLDSHTAAEDVRRETEDKLLRYLHTLLIALPNPFPALANAAVSEAAREQEETRAKVARKEKNAIRGRVEELARGMTTLKLPNELAWSILLEWRDMEEAGDWDIYSLKRYMDLYPESGMSKLAQIVLHLPDPSLEKDAEAPKLSTDQAIEQVDTAFAQIQAASVRAHLLASSFYLQQKDYELVIDTAEAGLASINRLEADIGRQLTGLRTLLETDLAVSLTHHDSPRHHVRALRLADTVLQRKPAELRAILAKAYIFESSERWQEAYELFQRVESEDTEPRVQFEARREKAWCLGNVTDRAQDALDELYEVATLMDQDAEIERVQKAQAWWRCGQCSWKMDTEEHTAAAFDAYITGIKRDNTYAPAFTALGFYYLEAVDPPNHKTATKCFQKAFELDEKEDVAARYLADEFAENGDWDLVEIVARRVVSGDHRTAGKAQTATEAPSSGTFAARKHAWAWKAIGAAELKSKKFPQAITALQYAIRGVPGDVSCWLQLAIAYRGSGKHVAALKTLGRVVELDSGNWHAHYLVGDIQRQLGLFDAAIRSFEQLQDERPDELAIRVARAETQLLFALSQIRNGFTSRGASELVYSLELAVEILQDPNAARIAWKLIADALAKLGSLPEGDKDTIQPILSELLSRLAKENIDAKNPLLTVVTTEFVKEKVASMTIQQQCMCMSVLACSMRVLLHGDTDEGAGSTWYDLGHALHQLHPQYAALETQHKPEHVVMQSIQCLRNALQREPLNGQFWNLLGVIATESTPKLAQHSLIRACELNVRSAIPWSNLGLFYLKHEDYELANKAFLRAQVLEPDYAQAWLGQAALARLHGDTAQATVLTEHAAGLSNGSVPDADLASATNAFDASRKLTSKDLFIRPRFLTTRYLQQKPATSAAASHLDGLLCERLERKEEAVTSLEQAVQLLEAEYELIESEEVERRYIIANASLGRARLAVGQYEASITALDAALALLSDDSNGQDDQGTELRAQCLLVKGLDAYFLEDLEGSLKCFEDALAALDGRTDSTGRLQALKNQCTLLLAGVLYGLGGDEQRAEAERQLLENISDASTGAPNVSVITALSALAIVGDNGGLLDAALAEILKLPVDQQIEQDRRGDIAYLSAAHRRLQDDDDGVRKTFAHALHALPTSSHAQASFLQAQQQVRSVDDTVDDSTDAQIHATPFELQAWAAKSASLSAASLKR